MTAPGCRPAAVVLEPGRDLGDVLAGQVADRVEHVRAGVEQEAAARQLGLLPPRPERVRSPVLPRRPRDVQDAPTSPLAISRAAVRTCGDRLPGKRRRAAGRSDRGSR
jgi:hypothetical protein